VPTIVVAGVIAAVSLGGLGLDRALASPSAGVVDLGAGVSLTAAPGWVLSAASGDVSAGTQLRKADAVLTAQVADESYAGTAAQLMDSAELDLRGATAQISFGDTHGLAVNGHDASAVSFQATVSNSRGSGAIDGEVIAIVIGRDAIVVELASPQWRLGSAVDDVTTMLDSIRVGP
jgi:galactokinase